MTEPARRRAVLAAALAGALRAAAPAPPAAPMDPAAPASGEASVDYHCWTRPADFRRGSAAGVRPAPGRPPALVMADPAGSTEYLDPHTAAASRWEYATWTSPARILPHPARELVASWNADTPPGTWIQVELRGTYTDGVPTPWYTMGRWAAGDADIKRTSVDGQGDGRSSIRTDTLAVDAAAGALRLRSYRLRLTLYRRPGTRVTPAVRRVGAMASDVPDRFTVPPSAPGEGCGHELRVPRFSQEIHKGQYPQYDNGGEAWCSPTSSEMALAYWGCHPSAAELAWVDPGYADPRVDNAARRTYDWQYRGCGNWPFNAAYAAGCPGMAAVVTRLRSLACIEHLIRHGIPVMTSQSFLAEELDGAGYGTSGHLMCVVGFTRSGDVIANDPAGADDGSVRRVYPRRQFENIWLRTKRYDTAGRVASGSGGVAYLYWPLGAAPHQYAALRRVGIR